MCEVALRVHMKIFLVAFRQTPKFDMQFVKFFGGKKNPKNEAQFTQPHGQLSNFVNFMDIHMVEIHKKNI